MQTGVMERARGEVSLGVAHRGGRHGVAALRQAGCGRLLFPAIAAGAPLEAVIVNTGGGLTGGDRFEAQVRLEAGAEALVTTQACEKIYRSSGETALVDTRLSAGADARLLWLPQETILFDKARLQRRLTIEIEESATLLALEAVLLGRLASGERLTAGLFRDSWRLRRGRRLVFAEEMALEGDVPARLSARATLNGAHAYATIVLAAPEAGRHLATVRDMLNNEAVEGGASTFDGLCVVRLVAQDGAALRRTLAPLLKQLGGELPRVWHN